MGRDEKQITEDEVGAPSLWAGVLIAPAAYFLQLGAAYGLVYWVCEGGASIVLHLITVAALALCVLGGYISWRSWGRAGREYPDDAGDKSTRTRFMAVSGLLLSALFFVGILAQEIPTWIVGPCVGR